MFLRKINVILFVLLNVSVTMSLRFFQSRKKKKECLVQEEWNVHNVTCTSKYQKCCATGCCDSAINNATSAYVKVFLVCAVISAIFFIIYTESWFKKKWMGLRQSCKRTKASTGVESLENNSEEMTVLHGDRERASGQKENNTELSTTKSPTSADNVN